MQYSLIITLLQTCCWDLWWKTIKKNLWAFGIVAGNYCWMLCWIITLLVHINCHTLVLIYLPYRPQMDWLWKPECTCYRFDAVGWQQYGYLTFKHTCCTYISQRFACRASNRRSGALKTTCKCESEPGGVWLTWLPTLLSQQALAYVLKLLSSLPDMHVKFKTKSKCI